MPAIGLIVHRGGLLGFELRFATERDWWVGGWWLVHPALCCIELIGWWDGCWCELSAAHIIGIDYLRTCNEDATHASATSFTNPT